MNGTPPVPAAVDRPHGRRVIEGSCTWISPTAEYLDGVSDIRRRDPFAWGVLVDQIEQSMRPGGLARSQFREPQDYRCPLERHPKGLSTPPWLGELKANGRPPGRLRLPRMWRLYFGEPIDRPRAVIAIRLHHERTKNEQHRHIREAMQQLIAHFARLGHSLGAVSGLTGQLLR